VNERAWPVMGAAVAALMIAHVARNPFGAWVLFSACDVAAVATAAGLLLRARRIVALALLFQLAVGLPAFLVGLVTTYVPTLTGVAVHLAPTAMGVAATGRRRWPPRAALVDWAAYVALLLITYVLTPPAMNLNLVHAIWPPLSKLFASTPAYHAAHAAAVLAALQTVAWATRRRAGFSSPPGAAPTPPAGTA
jgi:hypothetical protein